MLKVRGGEDKTLNGSMIGVVVLSPVAWRCYLDRIQFLHSKNYPVIAVLLGQSIILIS